jgi:hypothetical protein
VGLRDENVRPLYDGFAPAPSYRWVDPPPFFAAGNSEPAGVTRTIALGRDGSEASGIATPDGQFVLNLGAGAIAPSAGATRVAVTIRPRTVGGLGHLPHGLRANGNTYGVTMYYEPSHVAVATLHEPGSLALQVPEVGADLFTSARGIRWEGVPAESLPPRDLTLTARFVAPGYYVSGTSLPELVAPASDSSSNALWLGLLAVTVTLALIATGFVVAKRRASSRRATPPK